MRIIEENKTEEIICTCSDCGCKFAYLEEDTYSNPFGRVVECPSCHKEIFIKKFERMMQFPESYFHYDGGKDSKIIDNETIEKEVKKGIKYCLEHNECQWYTAYGNMYVEVNWLKGDNDFNILVGQNYYENSISEKEAKELVDFNYI